ncbi:hypothetical protein BU15DRAFT_81771 [Melanogaster broomeanus]|nr:hypothetical protein BU15DRAFT_81771 [Melanogaster broomeanus]
MSTALVDAYENLHIAGDNTMVLEVDNLLSGWPTYVIDFTPDQPGPIVRPPPAKLVLRLKDALKYVWVDDEDSEDDTAGHKPDSSQRDKEPICSGLFLMSTPRIEKQYSAPECVKSVTPICLSATPVTLHGIPKDIRPVKRKMFDGDDTPWPPPRPRAFRPVANSPMHTFTALKTVPAPVKAATDNKENVV